MTRVCLAGLKARSWIAWGQRSILWHVSRGCASDRPEWHWLKYNRGDPRDRDRGIGLHITCIASLARPSSVRVSTTHSALTSILSTLENHRYTNSALMGPELKHSTPIPFSVFSYWKQNSVNLPFDILFWLVKNMDASLGCVLIVELANITPSCVVTVVQEVNKNLGWVWSGLRVPLALLRRPLPNAAWLSQRLVSQPPGWGT